VGVDAGMSVGVRLSVPVLVTLGGVGGGQLDCGRRSRVWLARQVWCARVGVVWVGTRSRRRLRQPGVVGHVENAEMRRRARKEIGLSACRARRVTGEGAMEEETEDGRRERRARLVLHEGEALG
jgi:hypothetical protein